MATIKNCIITETEEINLYDPVEVKQEDLTFRGILTNVLTNVIEVTEFDKNNKYKVLDKQCYDINLIEIKKITEDEIYEEYERIKQPEEVPVVNDFN